MSLSDDFRSTPSHPIGLTPFEAAPFIAAHGWYRQATAGPRNALEGMTCAVAFAEGEASDQYTR